MYLACIINIGFLVPIHRIGPSIISLTRLVYWRITWYPGLLWPYPTQCWGVLQFSACNIPTGTTAHVSTSCSEPFLRIFLPSKSNPSSVVNAEKYFMPKLASFQGLILPSTLHCGFLYMSPAQHSVPSAQTPPQVCSICLTSF